MYLYLPNTGITGWCHHPGCTPAFESQCCCLQECFTSAWTVKVIPAWTAVSGCVRRPRPGVVLGNVANYYSCYSPSYPPVFVPPRWLRKSRTPSPGQAPPGSVRRLWWWHMGTMPCGSRRAESHQAGKHGQAWRASSCPPQQTHEGYLQRLEGGVPSAKPYLCSQHLHTTAEAMSGEKGWCWSRSARSGTPQTSPHHLVYAYPPRDLAAPSVCRRAPHSPHPAPPQVSETPRSCLTGRRAICQPGDNLL